ncbi:MAG TPA: aromatic acid exporter family protein [Mycobacteriales bacterium]|nr:aromatic acid exporter family protein [Mycobacteriales bacterium]
MRAGWRRLRKIGLRRWLTLEQDTLRQIAKTAVAATLSWELAIELLHTPIPALAALGAILTVQVTVKQTVTFGIQQVVGVTVGVGGAIAVVRVLGVHTWTVGIVILIALVVGHLLRLGKQVNQVAISALLVLALGTGYGTLRIVDTLLGAVVGVLVNALLAPPTHVQSAAAEIARVAADLGLLLADIGTGLRTRWDHRAAQDWLRRARELDGARARAGDAVRRGDESLLYNPLARNEAEAVARLTEAHTALEHVATQLRGVTRALSDLSDQAGADFLGTGSLAAVTAALADPLEQAGAAVAAFGRLQVGGDRTELERAHDAAVAGMTHVSDALERLPSEDDPRTLVSLYVDAGRLLHEIDPADGAHTGAV